MVVQDDSREIQLIELCGLVRPENHSRGGVDALLPLGGAQLKFEIKSTTRGSVTTVRDFGPDHVEKWVGKHWLIGVYNRRQELGYVLYGTPEKMAPWIESKHKYILPDFELAALAPENIGLDILFAIVGQKDCYSVEDAFKIQKKQYTKKQYREMKDLNNGYSPARMLQILRDRCEYLIKRGSTLNNPHIPSSYFKGWLQITANHAAELRRLARAAGYPKASDMERAT
jgi:hypothetical protein